MLEVKSIKARHLFSNYPARRRSLVSWQSLQKPIPVLNKAPIPLVCLALLAFCTQWYWKKRWLSWPLNVLFLDGLASLGPSLFFSCPMDFKSAEGWFVTVWNYIVIPYLHQALRSGRKVPLELSFQINTLYILEELTWRHAFQWSSRQKFRVAANPKFFLAGLVPSL